MQTIVVDSQLLSSIQRCPARTNFYFEKDFRTIEKPLSLVRGTLIHYFFSKYYGARKESDNKLDWESCAQSAWTLTRPESVKLELPDIEINNVFRSLEQYVEFRKHEPMEVKFVEEPFAFELYKDDTLRIVYVGVIDLIASLMGSEDKLFDHKSQTRRSEYILLDDQFEGYCTATQSNNLWVNVIGLQTSLKPDEKFRRVCLSYPQDLLNRWKTHVIYWVKQYLIYSKNDEWPENHQGCFKFQLCEFYEVCCSATPESKAWKLQNQFLVGDKWDPTSVLEHRE
jgi:hypothetical protein